MQSSPMRVIIFKNGHRPIENFYGLLDLCVNNKTVTGYLINNLFEKPLDLNSISEIKDVEKKIFTSKKSLIYTIKNFLLIRKSNLVFGKFSFYFRIILKIFNWKGYYICVPPGKITKATGYYKTKKLKPHITLKNLFSNRFLRTYIVAADELDRIYLSSTLSYPIDSLIVMPYPKHIWIAKNIQISKYKNTILFAPTEREKGAPSPISILMNSFEFINTISQMGLTIYYSQHIHDKNNQSILSSVKTNFNGDWSKVLAVVTDYSSIGADFMYSGGYKSIYYTIDHGEFIASSGLGPLIDLEFKNGAECKSAKDLLALIRNLLINYKSCKNEEKFSEKSKYFHLIYDAIKQNKK